MNVSDGNENEKKAGKNERTYGQSSPPTDAHMLLDVFTLTTNVKYPLSTRR